MQNPEIQSVVAGNEAIFKVKATGENLQFQWQKDRSDLHDDSRYCDTDTDTLRIVEVNKSDKGRYRCLVKNAVGNKCSDEALLTVGELHNDLLLNS